MPRLTGLQLQDRLIARGARIPIIFISGHGDIPMAVEAMRKGALDFLVKPFDDDALMRRVLDAIDEPVHGRRRRASRGVRLSNLAALTDREREVLARVLDGKTNRVVAQDLSITAKTVEYHRARIMRKLRVRSAAELFRFCLDA
jgi:FixJ family two-component response regulator